MPGAFQRFLDEARVLAKLAHPNIPPVHERGLLSDGRLYFAMKDVRGRPLTEPTGEVHAVSRSGRWEAAQSGWTLRRLTVAFGRACEAVGHRYSARFPRDWFRGGGKEAGRK